MDYVKVGNLLAGLYKTCYDPHLLTSAMKFDSGSASAHLFNTLHSHEGDGAHSSLASVRLNAETDLGLDRNHSFPFHQAELSGDRAGCDEVMSPVSSSGGKTFFTRLA